MRSGAVGARRPRRRTCPRRRPRIAGHGRRWRSRGSSGVHRRLQATHWFSHASAALIWGLRSGTSTRRPTSTSAPGRGEQPPSPRHRAAHPMPDAPTSSTVARAAGDDPGTHRRGTARRRCGRSPGSSSPTPRSGRVPRRSVGRELVATRAGQPRRRAGAGRWSSARTTARSHRTRRHAGSSLLRDGLPLPQTQVRDPDAARHVLGGPRLGAVARRCSSTTAGASTPSDATDALMREKRRHDAIVEAGWRCVRVTTRRPRGNGPDRRRVAPLLPPESIRAPHLSASATRPLRCAERRVRPLASSSAAADRAGARGERSRRRARRCSGQVRPVQAARRGAQVSASRSDQGQVEGDHQADHQQEGRVQAGAVAVAAHDRGGAGQVDQGDDRERDAEGEDHLRHDQRPGRVGAEGQEQQRRDEGDRAAQDQRARDGAGGLP